MRKLAVPTPSVTRLTRSLAAAALAVSMPLLEASAQDVLSPLPSNPAVSVEPLPPAEPAPPPLIEHTDPLPGAPMADAPHPVGAGGYTPQTEPDAAAASGRPLYNPTTRMAASTRCCKGNEAKFFRI